MILVQTGVTNDITYISRYENVHKYEIVDHSTSIIYSAVTNITAIDGEIVHSGLTFNFLRDNLYTYRSYYISGTTETLANQSYLTTLKDDSRLDDFIRISKQKNSFKFLEKL